MHRLVVGVNGAWELLKEQPTPSPNPKPPSKTPIKVGTSNIFCHRFIGALVAGPIRPVTPSGQVQKMVAGMTAKNIL